MYISYEKKFVNIANPRTASVAAISAIKRPGVWSSTDVYSGLSSQDGNSFYYSKNWDQRDRPLAQLISDCGLPGLVESTKDSAMRFYASGELSEATTKDILCHHLTPTHLVKLGLLTEAQIAEFNIWGFVREPLERWVSAQFLIRKLAKNDSDALAHLVDLVRSKEHEKHHPIVAPFQKDYFYYEGELVSNVYPYEQTQTVISDFIEAHTSTRPKSLPYKGMLRAVPDTFKAPIEEWFPADCIAILQDFYADDIAFYNSIAG